MNKSQVNSIASFIKGEGGLASRNLMTRDSSTKDSSVNNFLSQVLKYGLQYVHAEPTSPNLIEGKRACIGLTTRVSSDSPFSFFVGHVLRLTGLDPLIALQALVVGCVQP